jgi:hypothetical protein
MKKKLILISSSSFVLLILAGAGWYYWKQYDKKVDESKLRTIESELASNKEINDYLDTIQFSNSEEENRKDSHSRRYFNYDVTAVAKDSFLELDVAQQQEKLVLVMEYLKKNVSSVGLIKCGERRYCEIGNITVFDSEKDEREEEYVFSYDDVARDPESLITADYEGESEEEVVDEAEDAGTSTVSSDTSTELYDLSNDYNNYHEWNSLDRNQKFDKVSRYLYRIQQNGNSGMTVQNEVFYIEALDAMYNTTDEAVLNVPFEDAMGMAMAASQ